MFRSIEVIPRLNRPDCRNQDASVRGTGKCKPSWEVDNEVAELR
jgi:hypothetical protein